MSGGSLEDRWAALLRDLFPAAHLERQRRVELAITGDGRPRVDRAFGVLATEAMPVYDADQVAAPDGTGYDSVADAVAATAGAYVPGGTDVPVADGGTGASTAAGALANLGAAPTASPAFTGTVTLPGAVTSAGAAPTATIGPAAGTGATIDAVQGTDLFCRVTLTTGTGTGSGVLFTLHWAAPRPNPDYGVWISGRNPAARAVSGGMDAATATATDCPIIATSNPAASTQYACNVLVLE